MVRRIGHSSLSFIHSVAESLENIRKTAKKNFLEEDSEQIQQFPLEITVFFKKSAEL
jgi:hypothetical protein